MYNEDKTPEELAEERDRFYIYTSYEEQLNMLTFEQIGRAICALYHYFHTGEKLVQEKEVNMMLSFMTSKLDDDTKRYAKKVKKRREDARKAGLASAEARREKARLAELAESEHYSTTVNDCQQFQPDRERDRDRDNDRDREKEEEREE
ncbi:MAG: hypothetical protein IJA90_06765, partial [Peptococcaceae bacterium]|nr:hypothetical protein [Peptococcaceae bacterium]